MVTDYGLSIEGRTADDLRRSCSVLFSVISLSSRLNIFLAKHDANHQNQYKKALDTYNS